MTEPSNVETREEDLYSIFDGTKGRSKGVYLDLEERKHDERTRAIVEEREPNLKLADLPGGAGTPLVTEAGRVDNSVFSNPSVVVTHEDGLMPETVVTTTELYVGDSPTVQNASPEFRVKEELPALDPATQTEAPAEPEGDGFSDTNSTSTTTDGFE
jgi:hypothetical protein